LRVGGREHLSIFVAETWLVVVVVELIGVFEKEPEKLWGECIGEWEKDGVSRHCTCTPLGSNESSSLLANENVTVGRPKLLRKKSV